MSQCVCVCVCVCVCEEIKSEKKGSEAFAKMEKKAPLSQPGLEPGSSAYILVGWRLLSTFANASLPLLFRFNLSPLLQRRNYKAFSENSEPWTAVIVCVCLSEKCVITKTLYQALEWLFHKRYA